MKSKELDYLSYGSVISISHVMDDHSFISADGFVKRSVLLKNFVYFLKIHQHHIDQCTPEQLNQMKGRPYYNCLFQILPKFTNSIKQEILKELIPDDEDEETVPAANAILDNLISNKPEDKAVWKKEDILDYSNKLLQEYKYNLDTFEKSKSLKLSYKAPIQLLHLSSSKFLACHQKEARFESQNYKITLDDLPSDNSLFKILPAYKYQKEGEQIIYASDIVFIVRATSFMNKLTYLHASGEMLNFGKTGVSKKSFKPQHSTEVIKREINAALDEENQTQWRISVYSEYVSENSQYIKCGDVIWLHHSETNTTIAAGRKGNSIDNKNFNNFDLIQWLSAENVELKVIEGSKKESYDEYKGDTHSMWIIEQEDYKRGGIVQYDQQYRFRHLASGLYLATNKVKFYLQKQRTQETLFYFALLKNVQQRDKNVKKASFSYICVNEEDPFWVDVQLQQGKYFPYTHQENHKTDQSVFKLYLSPNNDVWEIGFVLSCIKTLMNYLQDVKSLVWKNEPSDKEVLKDYMAKINTTKNCIEDLNDFCNNKLYNSTPEQKYATINIFRQKLLKEQYYIDLLIKILKDGFTNIELELWKNKKQVILRHNVGDIKFQEQKGLKEIELLGFVAFKIELSKSIYQLLTSICKNNEINEIYTFDLIPNFIDHCRYIPEAITCLISIVGNNQVLLNRLPENLVIDFNYKEIDVFEPEEEIQRLNQDETNNNLLMFFLNRLEDDHQEHKAQFVRFLRKICIFNNQGINQNQEIIFKLIKKYKKKKLSISRDREEADKLSLKDEKLIIPQKSDTKELDFFNEQLQFYADVSFHRNFLWKRELGSQFSENFLFQNIWLENSQYQKFQASFCKIAMSLYVDHDPLNRQPLPQFCTLYRAIDQEQIRNIQIHDQYKRLLLDLLQFLSSNKDVLVSVLTSEKQHTQTDHDGPQGQNLLDNELLYNSCLMVRLLLDLDVFGLMDEAPDQFYKQIMDIVTTFFMYDFKNFDIVKKIYQNEKKALQARKKEKDDKKSGLGFVVPKMDIYKNMNPFSLFQSGNDQAGKGDDDEEDEENYIDDVSMFQNPIMRGLIKLENELQAVTQEEKGQNQLEINIKLSLCEVIDRFLDMKQNYLMLNILAFFQQQIIDQPYQETEDEKTAFDQLTAGKNETEIMQLRIDRQIQKRVEIFMLALLPSISRTGIKDIDTIEKEENALQKMMAFGSILQIKKAADPPKEKFESFTKNIKQVYDPDVYLSMAHGDDASGEPVAAILPYLLTSFSLIHDEQLEKRSLAVIMRLFNQRQELCWNLQKLQLVSDPVKSKLFEYLTRKISILNDLVDKSEIWITDFVKNGNDADLVEAIDILKNFRLGFFIDTEITTEIQSKAQSIDPEKQNLMNALKIHHPILTLIRDQMGGFSFNIKKIQNPQAKQRLATLFIYAYQFLTNFCKNNNDNQLILNQYMNSFQYLEIEVGQIQLICEIYRNNQKLLNGITNQFLNKFVGLIESAGRKEQFLEPFLVFIIHSKKYIFDNQLLVLNTFLSKNSILFSRNYQFEFEGPLLLHPSDYFNDLITVQHKDQPYRYHAKLLDLLLQCTKIKSGDDSHQDQEKQDNFTINIAKLKKAFKVEYLMSLLCSPDAFLDGTSTEEKGMSLLKIKLCVFFRDVHITSEKSYVISKELVNQMEKFIDFEIKRFELLKDKNLQKYTEYLIEGILPLLTVYCERKPFVSVSDDEDGPHEEQRDLALMSNFAKKLSTLMNILVPYIKRKKQVIILRNFIQFYPHTHLAKALQDHVDMGEDPIRDHLYPLLPGKDEENADPILSQINSNDSLLSPRNETIFTKKNLIPLQIITQKKKSSQVEEEEPLLAEYSAQKLQQIKLSWDRFIVEFSTSSKSAEAIVIERTALADAITKFDKYFNIQLSYFADGKEEDKGPTKKQNESKNLTKKLINFMQYALQSSDNTSTIITALSVMREMLQEKKIEKGEEQQRKQAQQKEEERIYELKILFNKLGATRMILTVISESQNLDMELFRNYLIFMNQLLKGGIPKVQKTIYEFVKTYPKSEIIFQRLNSVIVTQIQMIHNMSREKVIDDQQQKSFMQQERLMTEVLIFLQNSCEGHYLDLQNYYRNQTNSRNSYNMINLVADLLKTYYTDKKIYNCMVLCLDTLNELVQGPCLENQIAVSESKFFEITSDLFSIFTTKKKSDAQDSTRAQSMQTFKPNSMGKSQAALPKFESDDELKKWQIERMQTKCLILTMSLLEMRELSDSNPIIKIIMRNLPITLLQKHMNKCYENYENQCPDGYKIEVLDRINEDPYAKNAQPEIYYQLILQKGFYVYFLMCYYMESERHMDNQFAQMYRQYTRKKLKQDKGTLEDLLFGDNIVGQLVSFVMSLANSWISLVNYFKDKTLENLKDKNAELTPEEIEKRDREKIDKKKQLIKKAFNFFASNSASIEIIRNNEIEVNYFILLPETKNLPKESREELHETVDRSSTKSKVQFLIEESDRLIEICKHEERLRRIFQQQKFLALFANYVKLWKDLAFGFTILLNIFIIGSFSTPTDGSGSRLSDYQFFQNPDYTQQKTKEIFFICGSIMTCCAIFVVVFFLFKNAPLIIFKAWKVKIPLADNENLTIQLIIKFIKSLLVILYILKEIEVVYYLAYGALAICGTAWHPFFFSFHLSEILIRYPTLKNVIRSVWEPRTQLGLTFILFVIIVYVYGLFAYTFFFSDYYGRCESTLFCFLYTFDWTFKANAGVGGYLSGLENSNNPDKVNKFSTGRFIFDNSSNIILVIIMVNIVAGIIIDTFGSLREEEQDKVSDKEDKCYICGNEKTTFDKLSDNSAGGGFNYHIKINHYMWNYVFFMAYLDYKDPIDYTGIEQYVYEKIKAKDVNWFPFNRARELQGIKLDEEKETMKVDKIKMDMQSVLEQMKSASFTLNILKNKKKQ